jgi:deoxyadenosine/deoxycytidine kinase
VSIEGNIGSGKSTLLQNLMNSYKENSCVIFLKEPVDDWEKIKDSNGDTMLKKFYSDQKTYSFAFQMMAYISRLKILRDVINKTKAHPEKKFIIITERSLFTDKYVFAQMLHDQGSIEDVCYQIYLSWFDEFSKDFPINKTIYVKTNPETCHERISKRARSGEDVIPLDYLKDCHTYHEYFLDEAKGITTNKLVLDGNTDIYKDDITLVTWIKQITNYIHEYFVINLENKIDHDRIVI